MLLATSPATWQDLQHMVCVIMAEAGLAAEVERTIDLVRGRTEVDVYAIETIGGRPRVILVECKHWRSAVPQAVVREFRTVISDAGADVGYIVSKAGFQSGAVEMAQFTNVRLRTWESFQEEFESAWISNHLLPTVEETFARLFMSFDMPHEGPWPPTTDPRIARWRELHDRYYSFLDLMERFSRIGVATRGGHVPVLPARLLGIESADLIPATILDATAYRDFLEAALAYAGPLLEAWDAYLQM